MRRQSTSRRSTKRAASGTRTRTPRVAASKEKRDAKLAAELPEADSTVTKPALVPQSHGGALLSGGVPGHRGGGGRPTNQYVEWCRKILETADAQVEAILADKNHDAFPTLYKILAEKGHPTPKVIDLNVRNVAQRLERAKARLAAS